MIECPDFVPLRDGTIFGDPRYCSLSVRCRQLGMISELAEVIEMLTGKSKGLIYMCKGQYIVMENRFKVYRTVRI